VIANPLLRRATFSELFGLLGLPPIKGTSCPCPFHEDKNPSCSVFIGAKGHEIAKCFKGCFCGDVYDMYARAFRCDRKAAFIELNHKLGIATATFQLDRPLHERFQPAPKSAPRDERLRPSLTLDLGDDRMVVDLSTLRRIHEGGVRLALERGLLGFGDYMGRPAWVMKDRSGLLMQARRLDGRTWFRDTKAITLKGSDANHLLGVQEAAEADLLFVCEGGPDMLAAHALMYEMALLKAADPVRIAVTGLMGASMRPRRATLAGLKAKRVIIWAHADASGLEGAKEWKRSFWAKDRKVDVIAANEIVPGLKDLNDVVSAEGGLAAIIAKLGGLSHA
jgi:hypothetical protein